MIALMVRHKTTKLFMKTTGGRSGTRWKSNDKLWTDNPKQMAIWMSRRGPIGVIRQYKINKEVEIVEFELQELP